MFNIPSLSTESRELLDQYTEMYERDPFCEVTMEAKLEKSAETRKKKYHLPFSMKNLNEGIHGVKHGNAARVDDTCTKQIKHFGTRTTQLIPQLVNRCYLTEQIYQGS